MHGLPCYSLFPSTLSTLSPTLLFPSSTSPCLHSFTPPFWGSCIHALVLPLTAFCAKHLFKFLSVWLPKSLTYLLVYREIRLTDILLSSHLISSQSLNHGGRLGTTDDLATIPFHFYPSSPAHRESPNPIPIHSLMLSSHLFCCLPLFFSCPVPLLIGHRYQPHLQCSETHRAHSKLYSCFI